MMQKLKKLLFATVISSLPLLAQADAPKLPKGGKVAEVHVLSLQFAANRSARMVARPCDKNVECQNILARISSKTTLRDNGQLIDYQQAKKLKWDSALLVVDKFNNALMVSRIPVSGYEE